jgi:hypothetical protein
MLSYLFDEAPKSLTIQKPSQSQKYLLLGYGAIGQALTRDGHLNIFSKDFVKVWDQDATKRQLAQNEGLRQLEYQRRIRLCHWLYGSLLITDVVFLVTR